MEIEKAGGGRHFKCMQALLVFPAPALREYPVYAPGPSGLPNYPEFVGDWAVPLPGSYKACLTMAGPDVETGSEMGKPWDPLGFSKLYDRNFDFNGNMTYPHVQWLRESELKHGRCAMLAIVGIFAQQSFHIAGYPEAPWYEALQKCYDNPQGIVGFGIAQISAFAMVIEGKFFPNDAWIGQMDREPGDLGFDPLKLAKDAESMKSILQLVQTCLFFCVKIEDITAHLVLMKLFPFL